ncbi:hypothetical protein [Bordetella flabilis]|uniref:hypothetical protein n=1 Tax=Bordetella flabilis TaxID=463014 RepID=UPI0018DB23F1|nr:hypothetical protein [Bordetella flabilis]
MAVLLIITGMAYSTRHYPVELGVQRVVAIVEALGLAITLSLPVIGALAHAHNSWSWHTVHGELYRFIHGLAIYVITLWTIGAVGDDTYRWISANPNDAAAAAVAVWICWLMLRVTLRPAHNPSFARSDAAVAPGIALLPRRATARDARYTAAHEAGHALVYAALGRLPPNVRLVVNPHADENGVIGFVTAIDSEHRLDETSFVEWHMLALLAGKLGETSLYRESTLGSRNDHTRWLNIARVYLSNHHRGIYYTEPQNKFEQEQNEAKLNALRSEHLKLLEALFERNADVFKQLAAALLDKRSLGREDLLPFLARVQLPPRFPLPFGPFQQFSNEWPMRAETAES